MPRNRPDRDVDKLQAKSVLRTRATRSLAISCSYTHMPLCRTRCAGAVRTILSHRCLARKHRDNAGLCDSNAVNLLSKCCTQSVDPTVANSEVLCLGISR
ncbi:hypothetical protein J6590_008932 [Homalodisca vitripennis]|nr:hypothetical protein J6590_008932 [Homalodisca vitripennis]